MEFFTCILQKKVPQPEPDLPDDEVKASAAGKWALELGRPEPSTFTVDDSNMASFIQVKPQFEDTKFIVASTVKIRVFVR